MSAGRSRASRLVSPHARRRKGYQLLGDRPGSDGLLSKRDYVGEQSMTVLVPKYPAFFATWPDSEQEGVRPPEAGKTMGDGGESRA